VIDFPDSFVVVGLIIKPHGIRGEVVVEIHCDDPSVFAKGRSLKLQISPTDIKTLEIEAIRYHKKRALVKFASIQDINEAEKLRGLILLVEKSALVPTSEEEYYYFELIDSVVSDEKGNYIGTVKSIIEGTGTNLLEIETTKGGFLLPFVKEYIVEVRRGNHEIIIKHFSDLMDINRR